MGTNRKQPFGYRIKDGRVVIDPIEEHWVLHLYKQYSLGVTIRELTELMNNTGVRYDTDKPWNKNMIARILADSRYTGESGWPKIIEMDLFSMVEEKKNKKAPAVQKTEVQTMLRRRCDRRITPHIEHEVLYLMNTLAVNPDLIKIPNDQKPQSKRPIVLKSELEDLLGQLPVNEEKTRQKLQEIAETMYETIDPREYETYRMRKVFQNEHPRSELDVQMIVMNISSVLVDSNGKVRIKLKNEQVIERGE